MPPINHRKNKLLLLLLLTTALVSQSATASEESFLERVRLKGMFFCRPASGTSFAPILPEGKMPPAGSLLTVRFSAENPVATTSELLIGSHTVTFYPGAAVRLLENGLYPISGRLAIVSQPASEPLNLLAPRFSGAILSGTLFIEVTPDEGTYIAMKRKGSAWFKDRARKVFELKNTGQLHFPLFGETVDQPELSGFWSLPPSSFALLRHDSEAAKASEPPPETEIATSSEPGIATISTMATPTVQTPTPATATLTITATPSSVILPLEE
ncbi:MAG TPA: hypothetical protein PKM56_08330 [Candidatus Rifleibacterium sp.]|nr:hypothetical protein [Candidatus Rifleibacterium sp.]